MSCTSWRLMVRPRPVPPKRRVVEESACANAREQALLVLGRDADAGVGDVEVQRDAFGVLVQHPRPDDHLALRGELHGVGTEVE